MIRAIVVRKVSESNERDGGFLSLSLCSFSGMITTDHLKKKNTITSYNKVPRYSA